MKDKGEIRLLFILFISKVRKKSWYLAIENLIVLQDNFMKREKEAK